MLIRTLLTAALCLPAVALAEAPAPATTAAASATGTTQLGEVQVQSTKALVQVLEQMKTAIKRPFDNDPKHYDDMVCRIEDNDGYRAQGALLDCGTQGWFNMRRSMQARDMSVAKDSSLSTTPTLGHPWHVVRLLNHQQLAALRQVLGRLPEPGKGDVQVILDDNQGAAGQQH